MGNLRSDIKEALPYVKAGAAIQRNLVTPYDDISARRVCGPASLILGFLLRQRGHQVRHVENGKIGTIDHHAALLNMDSDDEDAGIIDPTYKQFLHRIPPEKMPEDEVLIVEPGQTRMVVTALAQLAYRPNPYTSVDDFANHYEAIWNPKNYTVTVPPLEDKIANFEKGSRDKGYHDLIIYLKQNHLA